MDSQRRFVANASHELRTPLAIQRAAIQIGLDGTPTPEDLDRVREKLLEANRRSERLIDGLLMLAQSERGLNGTAPVALDALVRQVTAEAVPENSATVTVETEPVTVQGDAVLLARLVANLVENAVRYNRPGGTIDVTLTATASLTVRNTGRRVPEDQVPALFEPFRRLAPARVGPVQGAGLGLSIVRSIAQSHGATVTARPNPDGGLVLTVLFTGPI